MKFILPDVLTANLDDLALTIDGVSRSMDDIMALCYPPFGNIQALPAAADSLTWDVYIDIPVAVTAASSGAGAITPIILSNDGNYITEIQSAVTVGEFKAGNNYLVTNIATGATPIMPNVPMFAAPVFAGTDSTLYGAARFFYVATKDHAPMNGNTTVDVIIFKTSPQLKERVDNQKGVRKLDDLTGLSNAYSKQV